MGAFPIFCIETITVGPVWETGPTYCSINIMCDLQKIGNAPSDDEKRPPSQTTTIDHKKLNVHFRIYLKNPFSYVFVKIG